MTSSKMRAVTESVKQECAERLRMHGRVKATVDRSRDSEIRLQVLTNIDEHIPYLVAAVRISEPRLFAMYAGWSKQKQASQASDRTDLEFELKLLETLMIKHLPMSEHESLRACIEAGIKEASKLPCNQQQPCEALFGPMFRYTSALLEGDREEASRIVFEAIDSGSSLKDVYLCIFQESQYEIGRLWQDNKISVAQEHYCTAITQMIMAQLYPRLTAGPRNGKTVITTCVNEEQHEIGIRMVADLLELDGFTTFHVGANCPRTDLIKLINTRQADIVAVSATMAYHLPHLKEIISDIRSSRLKKQPLIMVGGYPFNQVPLLWERIGADGYSQDAAGAVDEARRLVGVC